MRPISLKFQCFGSYMEEQFIDFEKLEKDGLFLICGETGAGKTTILDAMCYALYGKSSGGLRGDMSVMRCKLAEKDDETLVEFVFDAGGKRYKFMRSLRYGRKNLRDYHNCMVLENGNYVPIFANPKKQNVSAKAEEIIGLNDEQFRQVVILPQGQFERFLVSDSAEKESILVSLFRADKWQKIVEEIYRRVTEEDQKLTQEMADIRSRLKDYSCENVEELQTLAEDKEENLEKLKHQAECIEKEAEEKKKFYEQAKILNMEFAEYEKRRAKRIQLESKREEMVKLQKRLLKSDISDKIHPFYAELQNAKKEWNKQKSEEKMAEVEKSSAEKKFQEVIEKQKQHDILREDSEKKRKYLAFLEGAEGLYQSLDEKKSAVINARKEWEELNRKLSLEKKAFEQADKNWLMAMETQQKSMEEYTLAQKQYLNGISSVLAEKLKKGEPCPVCGSTEHPDPAARSLQKVTEKDLEVLNKRLERSTKEVTKNADIRRTAESEYQRLQQKTLQAEQSAVAIRTSYEELLKQKVEGIENSSQLLEEQKKTEMSIAAFREEDKQIQQLFVTMQGRLSAAEIQLAKAKGELEKKQTELDERKVEWEKVLFEHGFADEKEFTQSTIAAEEKQVCRETLISYKTNLENAKEEEEKQKSSLEGKVKPEINKLENELRICENEQKNATKLLLLAQQEIETLNRIVKSLTKRKASYDKQRIRVDSNLEFASRLRGRSGISLQRYVLGVMLSSVTMEANRLLKQVHGGRYLLYRTNEIAGSSHKGGLELEVLDAQSGERRSVTTLSGGEKFLVALSLAIGLSTVVQAQGNGMRLGAMFVDEGFGTLDTNSIYDALEVLQGIQKANGLVGIISHVEILKDVIPVKLEIVKGNRGSMIR